MDFEAERLWKGSSGPSPTNVRQWNGSLSQYENILINVTAMVAQMWIEIFVSKP